MGRPVSILQVVSEFCAGWAEPKQFLKRLNSVPRSRTGEKVPWTILFAFIACLFAVCD